MSAAKVSLAQFATLAPKVCMRLGHAWEDVLGSSKNHGLLDLRAAMALLGMEIVGLRSERFARVFARGSSHFFHYAEARLKAKPELKGLIAQAREAFSLILAEQKGPSTMLDLKKYAEPLGPGLASLAAMLRHDDGVSDGMIAQLCGVSPQTVMQARCAAAGGAG